MSASRAHSAPALAPHEISRILDSDPNIQGFWVYHNHPQYKATFSSADNAVFEVLEQAFGDQYKGAVVTDTGEFGSAVPGTEPEERQLLTREDLGRDPSIDPTMDPDAHRVIGQNITRKADPETLVEIVSQFKKEIADTPNAVTFVFTSVRVDTPGDNLGIRLWGWRHTQG